MKKLLIIFIVVSMVIPVYLSVGANQMTRLGDFTLTVAASDPSDITPNWVNVSYGPFHLYKPVEITNPILTASDVTDVSAKFVADPFLFYDNSTWYMFFEVWVTSEDRGEIGLATSFDGLHWSYEQIVLSESFHLSYPYVLKVNGSYYMVPETNEINEVRVYQAANFPYDWSVNATLITGEAFADPSIFRFNRTWWMFVSVAPYDASCYLYYSNNLLSGWIEHPESPIISSDMSKARPAGRMFVFDTDRVIRLAQKGDIFYGEQVRAFEVDVLTKTAYTEHEILESPLLWKKSFGWNSGGMHQLDPWWTGEHWLCVADGTHADIWSIGIFIGKEIDPDVTTIVFTTVGVLVFSTIIGIGIEKNTKQKKKVQSLENDFFR